MAAARRLHGVLLGFLALAPIAHAQDAPQGAVPDQRVMNALGEAKLGYAIQGSDFLLDYKVDATRSQRVYVASETSRLGALELRDVWAVAARGKGKLPPDLAARLLTENARMMLGAWQANQGDDQYVVVFSAPLSADADGDTLKEVIEAVTLSADRVEKQLSNEDTF